MSRKTLTFKYLADYFSRQSYSHKFPSAGIDKMAVARQMPWGEWALLELT